MQALGPGSIKGGNQKNTKAHTMKWRNVRNTRKHYKRQDIDKKVLWSCTKAAEVKIDY